MTCLGNVWIVLVNSMGAGTWNNFAIVGIRNRKNKVVFTVVSLLDIDVELVVFNFGKFRLQCISQLGCNIRTNPELIVFGTEAVQLLFK